MNFEKTLIRASGVGHIMTYLESITEKQLERLDYLEGRPKPTEKQKEEIHLLVEKRDKPDELPAGAITHCHDLYNSIVYGIKEDIDTAPTRKGNLCEQDSLDLLSKLAGKFLVKNSQHLSNEFVKGTPDSIYGNTVIDTKTSWSKRSFDAAEATTGYYWQLMTYMWLTGARKGLLAYCLVDAPEDMVLDEIRRQLWKKGIIDDQSDDAKEVEAQVRLNMTFERIPAKNRLKVFHIDRDESAIKAIERRVKMVRKKLTQIHESNDKYKPEILL